MKFNSKVSVGEVLEERRYAHGDFKLQATVAQELVNVINEHLDKKLSPEQHEALHMICSKVSRIVAGNENCRDHWVDIAGYATLIADHLP